MSLLLLLKSPPSSISTYNAYGQAQASTKSNYFALGQAQTQIKQTYNTHGQAQAQIKQIYIIQGQAQAEITVPSASSYAHGQAQSYIYIPQYAYPVADVNNDGWVRVVI